MKRSTFAAALLCLASPLAFAADADFCQSSADTYADWVVTSQRSMSNNRGRLQDVQLEISRGRSYTSVVSRIAARANALLDKTTLSKTEIKADIYGLCMSLT